MEIDYKLKILGEKTEYLPRTEFIQPIINSKKKIFEITAGNGYGKTFLLNLLAYAFYADKLGDKDILKTLKERVSDYSNSNAYDLVYNLSFNLPNGKKILLSKAKGTERIVQYENSPPMGVSSLHQTVSILYDVPVDPSLRLNEVIKDLNLWNNKLRDKFILYNNLLDNIESQFNNVRDESKIEKYEKNARDFSEEINSKSIRLNEIEILLKNINSFNECEKLISEFKKANSLKQDLIKKEKEFNICPKPVKIDKKDENLIRNLQNELIATKNQFKTKMLNLISSVSNHPEIFDFVQNDSTLNNIFIFLNEIEIESIINDDDFVKAQNNFEIKLEILTEKLKLFVENEERGKKYIVNNFLNQLLEQIDELIKNGADEILEVLTKNDTNLLKKEIKDRIEEHKIVNYTGIKELSKNTPNSIKSLISQAFKLTINIEKESKKKGVDAEGEKYYKLKGEIDDLRSRITKTIANTDRFRILLSEQMNLNSDFFTSIESTSGIRDNIKSLISVKKIQDNLPEATITISREKQLLARQIEDLEKSARLNEAMLLNERNKNVSQYSDIQQKNIRSIKLALQMVIRNVGIFNGLISQINKGDLESFQEEEDIKFIKVAGTIIAFSMDNKILRADGNYSKLNYYDIIKKEFHCEGDVIIRKDDISTGLASANYLRQRIENVEGEYVIILLDEIGNMAKDTLTKVIDSIKKIEKQNRLILAVLTQPSDNKEVIKINQY